MHIWPGSPYPLGASYDGGGTNFAIFTEVADRIAGLQADPDPAVRWAVEHSLAALKEKPAPTTP